jgi:N-acetylmuramoyl-L-alanine amidase
MADRIAAMVAGQAVGIGRVGMRSLTLLSVCVRLCIVALCLVAAAAAQGVPDVRAIRFAGAGDVTRVILESDRELKAETSSASLADGPALIVHLPVVSWSLGGEPRSGGTGEGSARVVSFAFGPDGPTGAQLVLALDGPARVMRELSLPPGRDAPNWRLVIDLEGDRAKDFEKRAERDMRQRKLKPETESAGPVMVKADKPREGASDAKPAPLGPMALMRAGARRHVIVIDPGHGGRDPGAVTASGLTESEVNLKTSLALRDMLAQSPRFDVRLTREDDTYLKLEERVERARGWGAELFISVHADAAESATAKGASVYTLSESGAKRSKALADREDWVIPLGEGERTSAEVVAILEDLVERETKTQSAQFANGLVEALARSGPMLRNSHRSAGFVVLFAPDVPAVLVELGFLTHPEDARRLASEAGRNAAAQAIAEAVTAYFDERDRRLADG